MKRALPHVLRLGLGGLFLWAAAGKIADPHAFARDIANYRLVPDAMAPAMAALLPFVEVGLGLAVVLGVWTRAAAIGIAGLLAVFTVAVVAAFARGIDVACGCFGGGGAPIGWLTVARDVGLLAAAIALVVLSPPGGVRGPRREPSARAV